MTTQFNPFDDLLENNRELTFLGALNRRNVGKRKSTALRGMFGQFQDEFLGRLGSQVLEGKDPTLRFSNYLKGLDFDREFRLLSPRQRRQYNFPGRVRHLLSF